MGHVLNIWPVDLIQTTPLILCGPLLLNMHVVVLNKTPVHRVHTGVQWNG